MDDLHDEDLLCGAWRRGPWREGAFTCTIGAAGKIGNGTAHVNRRGLPGPYQSDIILSVSFLKAWTLQTLRSPLSIA